MVCPTIVEVTQEQMKANEDFADFANRVRDMATRAKFTVPQDQMIQMIINNAHGPLKLFFLMNEYNNFDQLYAREANPTEEFKILICFWLF